MDGGRRRQYMEGGGWTERLETVGANSPWKLGLSKG